MMGGPEIIYSAPTNMQINMVCPRLGATSFKMKVAFQDERFVWSIVDNRHSNIMFDHVIFNVGAQMGVFKARGSKSFSALDDGKESDVTIT